MAKPWKRLTRFVTKNVIAPVVTAVVGKPKPLSGSYEESMKPLQEQINLQNKAIEEARQIATAAQRNAEIQEQDNAARQAVVRANAASREAISRQAAYQKTLDAANAQKAIAAAPAVVAGSPGAGEPTANFAQGKGAIAVPVSVFSGGSGAAFAAEPVAPAAKPVSSFTLPDVTGLKFGGT